MDIVCLAPFRRLALLVQLVLLSAIARPQTSNVIGQIDTIDAARDLVLGWAIDQNHPSDTVQLTIVITPTALNCPNITGSTTYYRSDLLNLNSSWTTNRAGFSLKLPPRALFGGGSFTVTAGPANVTLNNSPFPTPFGNGSGLTAGAVDIPGVSSPSHDGSVAGWGARKLSTQPGSDVSQTLEIEAYSDDLSWDSLVDRLRPNVLRTDVNNAMGYNSAATVGFSFKAPNDLLYASASALLHIYAVDRNVVGTAKFAVELTQSPATLLSAAPQPHSIGAVSLQGSSIIGQAVDPKQSMLAVTVNFYADGPADIGTLIGSATTSASSPFSFPIPSAYTNGSYHRIYAAVADSTCSTLFTDIASPPIEIGTMDYALTMCPAPGARDYSQLFIDPGTPLADEFCFYGGHWNQALAGSNQGFLSNAYNTSSGSPLTNLTSLHSSVPKWGVEVPVIKSWGTDQNGTAEAASAGPAVQNMLGQMGGSTSLAIQFDEPLVSGRFDPPSNGSGHPAMSNQAIALVVSNKTNAFLAAAPNFGLQHITITDNEAYPMLSVAELTDYLGRLTFSPPTGVTIDVAYGLDIDRNQMQDRFRTRWLEHLRADIQRVSVWCKGHGFKLAPLLFASSPAANGGSITSAELNAMLTANGQACYSLNAAFVTDVLDWAGIVGGAIGVPDVVQPQSWCAVAISDQPSWFPACVPDCVFQTQNPLVLDASFATMSWNCLITLTNPAASFLISQSSIPTTVMRGNMFNVVIAIRNDGHVPWNAKKQYWLASQTPPNNMTWGVNRIVLPSTVQVMNNQVYLFSFQAVAPATPGIYSFDWQMSQAGRTWFGPRTQVTITVQ